MKILFICGCLEPGKDGVGDYVNILTKELFLQNVEVAILAINDVFISEDKEEFCEEISILRLNANTTWRSRINTSSIWIDKFEPDHIIWQFVLYAYHPKGLPFNAIYLINKLLRNYNNVSLMFHELWIGAAREDSFLDKFTGKIQRLIIAWMVRDLDPFLVFTSNNTYSLLLKKIRIRSELLPLFSNIPFVPGGKELFKEYLSQEKIIVPKGSIKIGHFGRIPYSWQKQEFFEEIRKVGSPVVLFIAGRSDQMKASELEDEFLVHVPFIQVVKIGEQKADLISGFLQYIDVGITLNAPQILDKSGVFAAFKEHGLSAIVAGVEKHYTHTSLTNDAQQQSKIDLNGLAPKLKNLRRSFTRNTRKEISREFLHILEGRKIKEQTLFLEI